MTIQRTSCFMPSRTSLVVCLYGILAAFVSWNFTSDSICYPQHQQRQRQFWQFQRQRHDLAIVFVTSTTYKQHLQEQPIHSVGRNTSVHLVEFTSASQSIECICSHLYPFLAFSLAFQSATLPPCKSWWLGCWLQLGRKQKIVKTTTRRKKPLSPSTVLKISP